jgi:2-hydroxycyclohexanecarboxyl-CoA dehydrogenase
MDNAFDLTGRVALVTGAGQGVGRAAARMLAARGAAVAVNDFYAERAEAVAGELRATGARAVAVAADVTDYDAVRGAVAHATEALGPVGILVNNAGNAGVSRGLEGDPPFWETDPADWAPWMGTNFYGVLNAARAAVPGMVAAGWGRVISIVSDAGRVGEPHLVVYSGAKAGAAGFTRGLAKAVGRHGITANCVALAAMRTPATEHLVGDAEASRRALRGYAVRRFGEPEDAAAAVLFLASDEASWVTAQTYAVDGGYAPSL